jgi:hypothetical protein
MRDDTDLHRRLDAIAARFPDAGVDEREVEDLLTEGYAHALAGEAQSRRLERRLAELLPDLEEPSVAKEVRRLALQRRTVDHAVADLRARLRGLNECLLRAGEQPPTSA